MNISKPSYVTTTVSAIFFTFSVFSAFKETLGLFLVFLGLSISVHFYRTEDFSKKINTLSDFMDKKSYADPITAFVEIFGNILILVGSAITIYEYVAFHLFR